MRSLLVAAVAALLAAAPATAHEYTLGSLKIGHPWSRATAPGTKVAAGYLSVTNGGSEPDRLIAVTSPRAEKAEIHESREENGVAKMGEVKGGIEIAPGTTVKLEPSGYHVMLMGVAEPFKPGERVPATLTFEKAGKIDVELAVDKAGSPGPKAEDHTKHGS